MVTIPPLSALIKTPTSFIYLPTPLALPTYLSITISSLLRRASACVPWVNSVPTNSIPSPTSSRRRGWTSTTYH